MFPSVRYSYVQQGCLHAKREVYALMNRVKRYIITLLRCSLLAALGGVPAKLDAAASVGKMSSRAECWCKGPPP